MEAAKAEGGLLEKLRPPRLEDAGLEDCALPLESIKEAFLKAATAVGSRATSDDDETNDCVKDPRPVTGKQSDSLVGILSESYPPPGPCEAEKDGGVPEVMGDEVAADVTDAEKSVVYKVMAGTIVRDGVGEACVDGLKGLKIGEKNGKDVEEEREREGPILAEGFV